MTSIKDLNHSASYSYADYLTWQFDEMVELIKGKIFPMSPAPSRRHQEISGNAFRVAANFFLEHNCKAYSAPFDVRLPINGERKDGEIYTVVQPDLCIVCDLDKLDDRGCLGAPDLIVEILSPSTSKKDVTDKYALYEQTGVKEYWIIDPTNETLLPYALGEDGKYYASDKLLGREESITAVFLDDFSIALEEVFRG